MMHLCKKSYSSVPFKLACPSLDHGELVGNRRKKRAVACQATIKIYDANFVTLGMGASRKFAGESTVFVTISTGCQNDVGGNPSGGRAQLRLRAGADAAILTRLRLMEDAAWERGQYNRVDPSFLTERLNFLAGQRAPRMGGAACTWRSPLACPNARFELASGTSASDRRPLCHR